ncbi:hypothetical protein ACFU7X_03305 [Streptomyces chartreusis]
MISSVGSGSIHVTRRAFHQAHSLFQGERGGDEVGIRYVDALSGQYDL